MEKKANSYGYLVQNPLTILFVFLWVGFVLAISFMEAWLKFEAPGITIPLGLGIGKLVFHALNWVEWGLLAGIFLTHIFPVRVRPDRSYIYLGIAIIILLLQTFWWLPYLDRRADIIVSGGTVPPSRFHLIYIVSDMVKVCSLLAFGLFRFRKPV